MALKEIREIQDEQMNKKIEQVEEKSLQCDRNIEELDNLEQEIHQLLAIQEDKIDQQVELVKVRVDELAKYLKECIRESEDARLQEVQQEKLRQETLAEDMRNSGTTARDTLQGTPSKDYTRVINRFEDELNRVLAIDIDTICLNPVQGMLRCSMESYFNLNPGPLSLVQPCQLKLKYELPNFRNASAISATPNNYLAVCDTGRKSVTVLRKKPSGKCTRKRNLKVSVKNTTQKPEDVAVTMQGEFLVARSSYVEVYSTRGKYGGKVDFGPTQSQPSEREHIYAKLTNEEEDDEHESKPSAHRIAVTDNDTILLADLESAVIYVLPSDPEKDKYKLTTTINPTHIATCPGGLVSLLHKDKISVMSVESGEEIKQFHIPHAIGFCYHKLTDSFLITRLMLGDSTWTGIIEQYCAMSGRFVARLADGLYSPQDMVVTPDGQLAVADGKTVKVYHINYT